MRRKVALIGPSTLMISLPSKWAKKFGVKKGAELDIEEKGNELSIISKKETAPEMAVLKLSGPEKLIKLRISTAYKKGFDQLRVEFGNAGVLKAIKRDMDDLLGYEIIEQGENYCIIKDIAESLAGEFDTILRKLFLMLILMAKESYEKIESNELGKLEEIALMEKMNNKYSNFCKRILNKYGYKDYKNTNFVYCIVWELEKIADEYRDICNYLLNKKNVKISKEVLNLYAEVNKELEMFDNLFYKFDTDKAEALTNKRVELYKNAYNLLEKAKSKEEKVIMHHLTTLIIRIYGMSGPCYALYL